MNLQQLKYALSHFLESVPDRVRRIRWLVWLFVIGMTAFSFAGMGKMKFDVTIEGWFASTDPTIIAMEDFRARFGSDDHMYIVYKPKDGNVFSAESLAAVRALRKDLLQRSLTAKEGSPLKRIVKITALDNAPIMRVEDDALVSRNLVGNKIPTSKAELDEIAKTALGQRSLALQYFSLDHKYGGILVETNFGAIPVDYESGPGKGKDGDNKAASASANAGEMNFAFDGKVEEKRMKFKPTDMSEYLDFNTEVKKTLNKPEFASQFTYHAVGNPAATEFNMQVLQEMGMLYTAMLAIMVAVLWFVFRSISGVLWPTLIVILSAIWTIGLSSWIGLPFTAFLILTVAMILVIGIADSIHILSGYEYYREKGEDHQTALRSSFRSSGNACFLTATTGILGILSMGFTPIVPIQVEAVTTAAGIAFAFLFTIFLLPLMLDLWWTPRKKPVGAKLNPLEKVTGFIGKFIPNMSNMVQAFLKLVFPFVNSFKYVILGVASLALAFCLYGMFKLNVDTNVKSMFPKDAKIRSDIDIVDRHMMGSQTLAVYLDLGAEYAFQDPLVLNKLDELQRLIETKYSKNVVRTLSLVNVAKRSYQVLNDEKEEKYVVPETRQILSNTLFMFDNSNPGQRRKMVSDDFSKAHITVYLRNGGSYEYTQVFQGMQKDIDAMTAELKKSYPQTKATVTGLFTLVMQGSDYVSWNALSSFGWAVVGISIVLLLIFGTLKAGLISVAANAIPVTLTFGIMGLTGVPLDFTTVLIAPIVIGLAVDDTVHFLTHYRHELGVLGSPEKAVEATLLEAGQSVTYTSLILAIGLGVLAFSSGPGNANVGIYGSMAVLVGWLCELFLTPSLILVFGLRFKTETATA